MLFHRYRRMLAFSIIVMLSFFLSSCGQQPVETFIPLPPPVDADFPLAQLVQTVGDTEQVTLMSPQVAVNYGQTGGGSGGIEFEELHHKLTGKVGTMVAVRWGDHRQAQIKRAESFDTQGRLIEGRITMDLKQGSILQWLSGCIDCVINRSRLTFLYVAPSPGETPVLEQVVYLEEWGSNSKDILALGTAAVWNNAGEIFPAQDVWGFWETHAHPFDQVTQALDRADEALREVPPAFKVEDLDSWSELIGRQTGLTLYRNGQRWGTINFQYNNTWGQMPNTPIISQGALSRIEWRLGDTYRALSVLSPALSPEPTSLFVFSNTPEAAAQVEAADWVTLYEDIRSGSLPNVNFAIYGIGHIGKITQSVSTEDGTQNVDIGQGGGVFYSTIGKPSHEDVVEANQLMSLMGLGGIKASGNFYATSQNSGNGLAYYLSVLRVLTAPTGEVLDEFGLDVGLLDRPGFPEWESFDVVATP